MKMNRIRSTYHCVMELITPVHIGSGDRYVENFDYFYDQNRKSLFVFDRKRLLQQVADAGTETINSFTRAVEEETLDTWLKGKPEGIDMHRTLVHNFPCQRKPRDIAVQLRSGTGNGLIAGSSLKGAFRTAILARLSREEQGTTVERAAKNLVNHDRPNLKFADSQVCKRLLGPDAQKNLMRTLSVSDFSFDKKIIKLQNVVLTRLTTSRNMGVKFGVVLEKIPEQSSSGSQISFDEFLNEHGRETMNFRARLTLPWLIEAVRMKTKKTIHTERDFLQGVHGNYTDDLRLFYEELNKRTQQLDENEVILQLAWGSGWNGMTGELLEKEELIPPLRRKLQLAKNYTDFPFPKSRRLAVSGGRAVPMGWVRLRFVDKEEVKQKQVDRLEKERKKAEAMKAAKKARAQEAEVWQALSEIEQDCAIIRGDAIARSQAPEKNPLSDIWPKLESAGPEEKKLLADAFYKLWKDQPDRWRKKQCSQGQWKKVQTVVRILAIPHDDIQELTPEDEACISQLKALQDWGQFITLDVEITSLGLPAAQLLEKKLKSWGCTNRKAKKNKVQAWKELQSHLKRLRQNSEV